MYVKTGILLGSFAALYVSLVFLVSTWWLALPLAIILGLVTAGIGFNIQHDGGHSAYSDYTWVNKLMAMTLDLVGGSSFLWHHKHAVVHHTYVNITGHDTDIDLGGLGRLSPHEKRLWFHRWQHFYLWLLYGFLAIKWHFFDDFHDTITGISCGKRVPRPQGWDLVTFLAGKFVFLSLVFGIPLLVHSFWVVLLFYVVVALPLGFALSIVFQLAHAVGEAEFPMPREEGRIDSSWAAHQTETTVNFARDSRLAAWLFGGLNFQIEHHLFPRICHVNYPALSKVVEQVCRDHGLKYRTHKTFWSGLAAHYRWLRRMGRPDVPETANAGQGRP